MATSIKVKADSVDLYVSKRLKMRRIMLGLSQKNLAEAVDVSIQQIQKYEKSTNRISSGKLYSFANLLQVPVNYFFEKISSYTEPRDNINTSIFAEDQEIFQLGDTVPEKELINLIKAFNEVKDLQIRKKIIDLVKSLKKT
ncbi:helix-turn-helix family protein [Orientia chuto str. Dubai]|uniref:Helix-turn-helix family protein n=1 Tax=Orientia chuto str. Dubai TaxID=1359168 RepID=A0A0F3MNB6_9RICK|nr:helix-turn-helix transcriptional regulator [Candidatus Orientia mediorientalis]KJV57268.1 helix-turn-helix family protein [Orientia chuto str. Dubai]